MRIDVLLSVPRAAQHDLNQRSARYVIAVET